jgi:CMP-N-acetylneuraminic acid synthetase
MWPELIELRASELPQLVVDNGSTYVVDVAAFERHQTFYGPKLRGYEMPRERSIDIDTREDYEYALWSVSDPTRIRRQAKAPSADGSERS